MNGTKRIRIPGNYSTWKLEFHPDTSLSHTHTHTHIVLNHHFRVFATNLTSPVQMATETSLWIILRTINRLSWQLTHVLKFVYIDEHRKKKKNSRTQIIPSLHKTLTPSSLPPPPKPALPTLTLCFVWDSISIHYHCLNFTLVDVAVRRHLFVVKDTWLLPTNLNVASSVRINLLLNYNVVALSESYFSCRLSQIFGMNFNNWTSLSRNSTLYPLLLVYFLMSKRSRKSF